MIDCHPVHVSSHSQYSKAAEKNFPISLFNLAVLVYHGTGCMADQAQALDFYTRAANRDFAVAMFNLAQHYEHVAHRTHGRRLGMATDSSRSISGDRSDGDGDDDEDAEDFTYDDPDRPLSRAIAESEAAQTALMWLERAAASKMRTNQYVLSAVVQAGVFRLVGMGCPGAAPDRARAEKWFQIAHERGQDEGSFRLGSTLLHGDSAATREKGIAILKRISRTKSEWKSDALFKLGLHFLRHPALSSSLSSSLASSQGDDQSSEDYASSLLLKAAVLSHGRAALELGRLCEHNSDLAAKLGRAAASPLSLAQDDAEMLSQESSASGVTARAAFAWFKIAARRGIAEGQRLLSECYASGLGTAANEGKAQRWRAAFDAARAPFSAGAADDSNSSSSESALSSSSKAVPSAAASRSIVRADISATSAIDEASCHSSTSALRSHMSGSAPAAVINLIDDADGDDDDAMQDSAASSSSAAVSAPTTQLSASSRLANRVESAAILAERKAESDQDADDESNDEDGAADGEDDGQDGPEVYEVERICAVRHYRGAQEVKIKWKGYPDSASTWEPRLNIERGASDLLREFEAAKAARGKR